MATWRCAQIETNAELIEDYVHRLEPPLAKTLTDRFVAVQRQADSNRSDLLTVSPENELVLFSADPEQRAAWTETRSLVPEAPPGDIRKILAFHRADTLHALAHFPHPDGESSKVAVLSRELGGEWTRPPLDTETALLIGQTRQMESYADASGHLLIYGVSTSYDDPFAFISTYREGKARQAGRWKHLWKERRTTVGSFSIVPGRKPGEVKVLEVFGGTVKLRGARISQRSFAWITGDEVTLNLPSEAARVFPFVSARLEDSFLVQSADGSLYVVSHYYDDEPAVLPLTDGGQGPQAVASAQVGIDHTARTILFVIERDTAELWILRQRSDGDEPFETWVPLGNACTEIACPAVMADSAEVYLAALDARVANLSQDHVDAIWSQAVLETPKPLSEGVDEETTYRWEIRALDSLGVPAPNTVVKVKASATIEVLGNGLAAVLDRNHEEAFQTDTSGTLTLSTRANALASPELYVRVPDYMKPDETTTLWADERLQRRLAGREPGFPVNAESLKRSGAVPQKMADQDAGNVAKALIACGQFMQEKRQERLTGVFRLEEIAATRWRLTFSDEGRVTFDTLTREEVETARQAFTSAGPLAPNALTGGNPWGDFVHWLISTAKKLLEVTAFVADGLLHVTIRLAEGTRNFVLATIAQTGKLLEAIFSGIKVAFGVTEDLFRKAIEWLRMIFDWKDIIRTANYLEDQFAHTVTTLAAWIEEARPPVEAFFDRAADAVEHQLDELETLLSKGSSLSDLFGSSSAPGVSRNLQDDTYPKAHAANAVQCNFLSSSMPPGGDGIKFAEGVPGSAGEAALADFEDFTDRLMEALDRDRLAKAFVKIQKALQQIHDTSSLVQASLLVLLEVLKEAILIVLDAVKTILSAIMDWISKGLVATLDLLRAEIYVPFISEIAAQQGMRLSFLGLVSLLAGFFVTVLYKVIHGRPPVEADRSAAQKGGEPGAGTDDLLPCLYTFRSAAYAAKYGGAYAADPFLPAPFSVNFPSYLEIVASVVTMGIENFPKTKAPAPADLSDHLTSTGILAISVSLSIGYFLFMRRKAMKEEKALGLDLMISEINGFLEVIAAIIFTVETYQYDELDSNTRARMAKSYLTAFPDCLWAGSSDKEPTTSAIVGTIAVASYLGATVSSAFVETNV
jgi:hypothetical protein